MEKPILFFDGVCGLCNGAIDFVMKYDHKEIFLFSPLQSEYAQSRLPTELTENLSTFVVISNGKILIKSDAVLEIFHLLGGRWSVFSILKVLPRFIRNGVYDFVARNRYAWFGQKDTCRLPTLEEKRRFLLDIT